MNQVVKNSVGYDVQVLSSLRKIIRFVEMYSKKLSSSHRVTGPQLICLLTIDENQPVTATQIAKNVHLSPSTVVGVLDRLEEKGFVRRERDRNDRRRIQLYVTDEGRELAQSAPSPLQDKLSEAFSTLDEQEQSTIALSLQRIVDLMEVKSLEGEPDKG